MCIKTAFLCSNCASLDMVKPMQTVDFNDAQYSPFGMVTPGRSFAAGSGYRFGFNGKESDAETYGSGNIYDYGFRIYNPRLGKFLSVDPLTSSFPWYTPYQFAGNKPIWKIDLDGLEETDSEANHESPSDPNLIQGQDPTKYNDTERAVYASAGGDSKFNQQPNVYSDGNSYSCAMHAVCSYEEVGGIAYKSGVTDVSRDSYLAVGKETITSENFVIVMLGHFMKGTGPENYVFSYNGEISKELSKAEIVKDVYKDWYELNESKISSGKVLEIEPYVQAEKFGEGDQLKSIFKNVGTNNVENFVGSARVGVEVISATEIKVTVFNITSLTSGDFSKHIPLNSTPPSERRDTSLGSKPQPYTNISQTYSFSLPIENK